MHVHIIAILFCIFKKKRFLVFFYFFVTLTFLTSLVHTSSCLFVVAWIMLISLSFGKSKIFFRYLRHLVVILIANGTARRGYAFHKKHHTTSWKQYFGFIVKITYIRFLRILIRIT